MVPLVGVAVVIPVYRATYLDETLASVFAQTWLPREVIVIDDGSLDRLAFERAIAPFRDRIALISQTNQGAAAARNAGIRAATSEWVAFLDADDSWRPEFLAEQMAFLAADPRRDVVYSDGEIIGESPKAGWRFTHGAPSIGEATFDTLLSQQCTVLMSSAIVRRFLVIRAGLFDPALRRGQDFDLWLRVAYCGARFAYHRKPLVLHRVHEHNLSGTSIDMAERTLAIFYKAMSTIPLTVTQRRIAEDRVRHLQADLARERGKECLASGDFTSARQLLDEALRAVPSWKLRAAWLGLRFAPQLTRRLYLARASLNAAI
jgi:glycosyltransferase involved in cell wall biosynthesis